MHFDSITTDTAAVSDLFGDLSEVVDETDGGRLLEWVVDVVDVHLTLVKQVMENIDCLHGRRALLLVSKNQVDPFVEVGRHIVALQSLQPGRKTRLRLILYIRTETWINLTDIGSFLTSLWTLMNSLGSPLAQGGRMTSPSLVPFCLAPGTSNRGQIEH